MVTFLGALKAANRAANREGKRQEREREKLEKLYLKEERINKLEECKDFAYRESEKAKEKIWELENILNNSLQEDYEVDWKKAEDYSNFSIKRPKKEKKIELPKKPKIEDEAYKVGFNFLNLFNKERKPKIIKEKKKNFKNDLNKYYKVLKEETEKQNKIDLDFKKKLTKWNKEEEIFNKNQLDSNTKVGENKKLYFSGEKEAVIQYNELLLEEVLNPDCFPKDFEIDFDSTTKIIIINYYLPTLDDLPTTKEVKFIKSNSDFKTSLLSDTYLKKLYDNVVYQTVFKIINIILKNDNSGKIEAINFNGFVDSIDKSTGKPLTACIISMQTKKIDFSELLLENIDPKESFKKFKGISCTQLNTITPICPIISINKEDGRFIEARDVLDNINLGTNLAAINWQDFENLIREIFEKEFNQNGGECKITQASRDGGVDAIAFDPDPIKGGKIVIQAKRYTNVVGVSAIRDLYGTVMNEGANKGIIVSTSNYGPDAYKFAKGKPLTLLNGANLLHLLEKHGQKAYINIKEAKKILKEENN